MLSVLAFPFPTMRQIGLRDRTDQQLGAALIQRCALSAERAGLSRAAHVGGTLQRETGRSTVVRSRSRFDSAWWRSVTVAALLLLVVAGFPADASTRRTPTRSRSSESEELSSLHVVRQTIARDRGSQLAFHALSAARARVEDESVFGSALSTPSQVPSVSSVLHGRVAHYLNGSEAMVRLAGGMRHVDSPAPMAVKRDGRYVPIDLALRPTAGGFSSVASLHAITIGGRLSAGVVLRDKDVGLAMVGTNVPGRPLVQTRCFSRT